MAEYLVTVKDAECLDEFYADMEFRGYTRTIRKPLSRVTGYELTDGQVQEVSRDSRVLDVELRNDPRETIALDGFVNYQPYDILREYTKTAVTTSSQSDLMDWGKLHHAGTITQRSYGATPGTPGSTAWNDGVTSFDRADIFNNGKHVDIVICDSPIGWDHEDWKSEETGNTRFVQYDWYANHNSEVIGGLDSDGYGSPGTNYVYATAAQHGSAAYHGTHVMSTAGGKYYGWAKEANLYSINLFSGATGQTSMNTELMYDYIRAFHRNKSINPVTGFKNPTIVNCSYGSIYNLEETYPSGIQPSNVYGVYFKGELYDDGTTAYNGQAGTTPVGMKGVLSSWTSTNLERLFGIGGNKLPLLSTSNMADVQDCINDGVVICTSTGNEGQARSGDTHLYNGTRYSMDGNMHGNIIWLDDGYGYYYQRISNPYAQGIIQVGSISEYVNPTSSTASPPYGTQPASYTNRGINVHVWAAGSITTGVYPPGAGGVQDTKPGYQTNIDYFKSISGTSMASPQVTGILACYATGRERFTSADAHNYLYKTSNSSEFFSDHWARNYASITRKTHPITITVDPTDITVLGQDRRSNLYYLTTGNIRIEALDTINFTLPTAENHKWRLVKGSSTGLTNTDIDDPNQFPHPIKLAEVGGAISWTPGREDVGDWYLVCGCSLLPNHDGQPNAHTNRSQILIIVDPPFCMDDGLASGGSSNKFAIAKTTRPDTGLMGEWCYEKGNRWRNGHTALYLDHRSNRKNRAVLGVGEHLYPRPNALNRKPVPSEVGGYQPIGEMLYDTPGSYQWIAPPNVDTVSVVCIGGGGGGSASTSSSNDNSWGAGGGGGLGYKNNISVTPGQTYTVVVGAGGTGAPSNPSTTSEGQGGTGGDSYFINTSTVKGGGGTGDWGQGGDFVGENDGVGNSSNYGGRNGGYGTQTIGSGGAGAAGYGGVGAGDGRGVTGASGGGSGKGTVGGQSLNDGTGYLYGPSGGGGTGVYGIGKTGVNGTNTSASTLGGRGGSGGENGVDGKTQGSGGFPNAGDPNRSGQDGGKYGGGGGFGMWSATHNFCFGGGDGGSGAVRIIWGENRSFPNNAGPLT